MRAIYWGLINILNEKLLKQNGTMGKTKEKEKNLRGRGGGVDIVGRSSNIMQPCEQVQGTQKLHLQIRHGKACNPIH